MTINDNPPVTLIFGIFAFGPNIAKDHSWSVCLKDAHRADEALVKGAPSTDRGRDCRCAHGRRGRDSRRMATDVDVAKVASTADNVASNSALTVVTLPRGRVHGGRGRGCRRDFV